jgi:phosphohistidine phosphatase SixA
MAGIYLVRHGMAEQGILTAEGRRQAESARDELLRKGLGASALILSSNAPKALRTAEVIAAGLGVAEVLPSPNIKTAGNDPEVVASLDWVLAADLALHGIEGNANDLVVVTHMPLISQARFGDIYKVTKNGEVWEYPTASWANPSYKRFSVETKQFEAALGIN